MNRSAVHQPERPVLAELANQLASTLTTSGSRTICDITLEFQLQQLFDSKRRSRVPMPITVKSLDNVERPLDETTHGMKCRDIAAKLQKHKSLAIPLIARLDLIAISEWLTYLNKAPWEVGVVQDCETKHLRLVNGKASTSERIAARVGRQRSTEIFIVDVHPVVRSKSSHIDTDRKTANDTLEGVLDWSNILLCYTKTKFYNQPEAGGGIEGYKDASFTSFNGRIPFQDGMGNITGYRHFDEDTHKPTFINPFEPRT